MNRIATVGVVAALILSTGRLSAQGGAGKVVEVVGITLVKPLPKDAGLDRFQRPGTKLEVIVTQPGKHILEIDDDASKLDSITDDKNTDLNKTDGKEPFFGTLWSFGQRSKDGSRFLCEAAFPGVPAAGATKVRLKGTMVLLVGADLKTVEEKKVTIKKDAKFKMGPFEVSLGKAVFGNEPIVLFAHTSPGLETVVFLDKEGKPLPSSEAGRIRVNFGAQASYTTQYQVKGDLADLTVRVTYFARVEKITIPLDITVTAGF